MSARARGTREDELTTPSRLLYAVTIFASGFLLFIVQPLIARQILPWFGGSAGVWTTCLMFFQLGLVAGYAYSNWTTRRLSPARAGWPAHRAARRERDVVADRRVTRLEAVGRGRADVADSWIAAGHDRFAVLRALHDRPAGPGVVRARVSRSKGLSSVRAVEPGGAGGARVVSVRHRALGDDHPAGATLVGRVRHLHAALYRRRSAGVVASPSAHPWQPGAGRRATGSDTRDGVAATGLARDCALAGAAGDGHLAAARRHQSHYPEHRLDPVPMDAAADAVSRDVHHLLRSRALVPSRRLGRAGAGHAGCGRVRAPERGRDAERQDRGAVVCRRAVRLVHFLSRRTGAAQAGVARSDDVLPHDRSRRRPRRPGRRSGGAADSRLVVRTRHWIDADRVACRDCAGPAVRARPAGGARHRDHVRLLLVPPD